jgi:hypothetical protein
MSVLAAFAFALTAYWTFTQPMNPDEMEHLHSTYLLLRGLVPYVEFWQNHAPMLWFLLAPVMAAWPEHSSICYAARTIALLQVVIVFVVVVRLALQVAEARSENRGGDGGQVGPRAADEAAASVAGHAARPGVDRALVAGRAPVAGRLSSGAVAFAGVVFWGTAIPAELPILRTDGFMVLCFLLAALSSLGAERAPARSGEPRRIAHAGRLSLQPKHDEAVRADQRRSEEARGDRSALWAGFWVGLGLSFSIKLLALGVALPITPLVRHRLTPRFLRRCGLYGAGCVLGIAPLALYLLASGSMDGFVRWVLEFNAARGNGAGRGYDTVWMPALLGGVGLLLLVATGHPSRWIGKAGSTARVMALLSLFLSLFLFPLEERAFQYYVGPLVAFGAIFAAPETWAAGFGRARRRMPPPRVLSAALGCAVLVTAMLPAASLVWGQRDRERQLGKNLAFIQWMIDAARGRTVQCEVAAHPIYAYDLTPFYVPWQAFYALQGETKRSEMLRRFLRDAPPYEEVFQRGKPILVGVEAFRRYITVLREIGLIEESELQRLWSSVRRDYHEFNGVLYVRRAKPESRE